MSRKSRRKQKLATTTPPDPPKVATGRKTILTPDIHTVIVEAARTGTPVGFLGPLAGVDRSSVFRWLKLGAKPGTPYTAFYDAVKAAQSEFVRDRLTRIAGHGANSWQADAWLLERMFREEFGGDKLELNQLKKELKELRALLVQVPRATVETDAAGGGPTEGRSDGPADGPAAKA